MGQIGKVGGPKAWQEPVSPLVARQDVRFKIPAPADGEDVTLFLVASDAGDGNDQDSSSGKSRRLVAPGRPDLRLVDVRALTRDLAAPSRADVRATRRSISTPPTKPPRTEGKTELAELARKHGVEPEASARLARLSRASARAARVAIDRAFHEQDRRSSGLRFIKGWGKNETPLLLANSSDQHVRIPGNMKPHSIAVHPSPTLARGGRLAESGLGDVARRGEGDPCASRVRQRRDLGAGTAARGDPAAARQRQWRREARR